MTGKLLSVAGVSIAYGKVEAVRDVSLTIDAGQIVTVIGANGAGKSTLLNAIMGVLAANGQIMLDGRSIDGLEVEERVARGMSLVPERRELFAQMTVEDNLRLGGYRFRRQGADAALASVFQRYPRLAERRGQLAGTLSGGERQMLAIGRALMARPRLLLLDEPSLGLAPKIVREMFQAIVELRQAGVTILLVEQNARAALRVADYAYVMELGAVTVEGPAAVIAQDQRVIDSYLGLGGHH